MTESLHEHPTIRRFCTPEHIEVGTTVAFDRFLRGSTASEVTLAGMHDAEVRCPTWRWEPAGDSQGTVVLTHGWAASTAIWRAWVRPLLSAGFTVVAFDAPAHGRATGTTSNLLVHTLALLEVIKPIDDLVGVVGHSLGGLAAAWAANRLRVGGDERPLKLVLLATPSSMQFVVDRYQERFPITDDDKLKIEAWIEEVASLTPAEVGITIMASTPGLRVLVCHDRDDAEAWFDATESVVKTLPFAEMVEVTGTGHEMIMVDRGTIRRTVAFLSNARAA